MTRPRADLPPVTKRYSQTFRRASHPEYGYRRECWGAETTDGLWDMERIEDTGTPWEVMFIPTRMVIPWTYGTLKSCREAIAKGGWVATPEEPEGFLRARPAEATRWTRTTCERLEFPTYAEALAWAQER